MDEKVSGPNFIKEIIGKDIRENKNNAQVVTRFPPEPNGFLHIGHAKSICLNFGLAQTYQGRCHLRFDDTNPSTEDILFMKAIEEDVHWLGFDWGEHLYYASDYFEKLYHYAIELIKLGKAYVCSLNPDQIREYRGTLTEPGRPSPYRNRTIEENLDLFNRMRTGEFADGTQVLRAKIDMNSPNLNMRDPVIYRIKKMDHPRTGDKWCIYPMYDFTHCLSDALEGITHSICTLEFEDHRPLYDWVLDELETESHPQQIEFARLNLTYTVMSKRKLKKLVEEHYVDGWDDPRMPTISGLKRRGYTPEAIRGFCERIGVTKKDSCIDMVFLENCIRDDLNKRVPRIMCVLNPIRVVIENYLVGQSGVQVEELEAPNHPSDPSMGSRRISFGRELFIEQEDFMENPPKGFFRLSPGAEVRLRYAYFIRCVGVVKDPTTGAILELRCTYDPTTRGGDSPDGRKVKGTLHWVSASDSVEIEVHLYDRLFVKEFPDDLRADMNPNSLIALKNCRVEPSLLEAKTGSLYQFERQGYFCVDQKKSKSQKFILNRTVTLKDSWSKMASPRGVEPRFAP